MRRFEYVLLFAEVFAVFWPVVFGVRPRRGLVALVMSAALVVQLQFEGFRWQMIPIYVVAVGLAVGDVFYLDRRIEGPRRLIRGILGAFGLAFVAVLPLVLPVPEIPTPGGPESIGTFSVDLVDSDRNETYGQTSGPRQLAAQVWYPARTSADRERLHWSEDWEIVAPAIASGMGLPSWFWNHTGFTLSHASESPALAAGTFPVVVYSHGWGGVRSNALNQIERLVSNGYIVIALDHTYSAAVSVFEDGDIVYQDPAALPDESESEETDPEEAASQLVATQAQDLVTVLDALEQGETGPFGDVAAAADLNRIGVYGHSTGGGAAIKVCLEDERCAAVLAMDPWVSPFTEEDLELTMTKPALYMRSGDWLGTPEDALLSGIAARGEAVTYNVGISNADTNDFVMVPLLTPLASQFGWKGPIPSGRIITIVDNYLLGFFDVFLLDTGTAQLDSVSFEGVNVSVVDPQG